VRRDLKRGFLMTTGGGVNWVDAVVVKVLVVLLLPLLGAYLSITACVGFVHASLNVLWWSLRTKCGNRAKGKHQEGTSPALDYFWVTAWLVTYLVVTPVSLAVFFLSLGLPFLLITPQAGSMIHLVHKGLVTAFCAYCVWAYLLDDSVSKGGLTKARLRRSAPLSHIARYFGMTMTVADDDGGGAKQTSDNCIFCYHPHGILFWGVIGGFANQSWGVRWNSKTLAELDVSLGTISFNNFIPFFREVNKNLGAFNVSWRGCNRALEEGRNIFIVPGGARESIHAYPGTMNVCIKQRKGFIRLALKQGKPLVPVLSFGAFSLFAWILSRRNGR